jgi:signal transduction histidine kinase
MVFGALMSGQEPARPAPLTTCAVVRGLGRDEAARGLPVRLQGIITVVPPPAGGGFTLDDGVGIWVARPRGTEATERPADLRVGDWVEIVGQTQAGHFNPTVAAGTVRRLGQQVLPAPREIGQLELSTGALDAQRVSVVGVVQAAERVVRGERTEYRLVVSAQGTRFSYAMFDDLRVEAAALVDAEVRLTGVFLAYFNARRQFLGVRIQSNVAAELVVTTASPGDAFASPEVTLTDGLAFSAQGGSPHRRRVRGTVTLCAPGEYFYLQESDHALRVNTRQPEKLQPGDIVEAAGFFHLEHHKAEMQDATFRKVGQARAPTPVAISREQLFAVAPGSAAFLARDFDDYLVSVRGKLVSIDHDGRSPVRLNLEWEGALLPAEFVQPGDVAAVTALRPGSELTVSGVCGLTFSGAPPVVEWPQPIAMRLLLRDAADVQVLRAASWWTPERLWSALGLIGGGLLLALAWAAWLRRTVALRSAELAEAMRARRDAVVEFESTLRERNRLAADLHDTLEQSLTGLALQLEASEALQDKGPERSKRHMLLARQVLDRSREDLRRSLWNLRANPLESADLVTALREVAANRAAGLPIRITVNCEGTPRPLPDFVAGNLLLLAQEGITNALKHANAARIELQLTFQPQALVLAVIDDGVGFDPALALGPRQGHFGLQGMHERMKRLGGQLELRSKPGEGTVIRVRVPE